MKHFDIVEWADFVRGIPGGSRQADMEAHLETGCARCRRTVEMFQKLIPIARNEAELEVPEYVVHCARALAALARPERIQVNSRGVSRLVFDSFLEPLPAGVRSQHRVTRQTLYETGDYSVDLRQEFERGSGRVTLVGQIGNRTTPELPVASVPVYLRSGRTVVAHTTSNQFGEFQLAYSPRRNLRLEIPVQANRRYRVAGTGGSRRSKGRQGELK